MLPPVAVAPERRKAELCVQSTCGRALLLDLQEHVLRAAFSGRATERTEQTVRVAEAALRFERSHAVHAREAANEGERAN